MDIIWHRWRKESAVTKFMMFSSKPTSTSATKPTPFGNAYSPVRVTPIKSPKRYWISQWASEYADSGLIKNPSHKGRQQCPVAPDSPPSSWEHCKVLLCFICWFILKSCYLQDVIEFWILVVCAQLPLQASCPSTPGCPHGWAPLGDIEFSQFVAKIKQKSSAKDIQFNLTSSQPNSGKNCLVKFDISLTYLSITLFLE